MNIENPGFKDFREDASCTIRPQALIGEKYVDCLPTQPRVEGAPLPPPLKKIPSGQEGAGDYRLPLQNTSSPVDVDLLGDIQRLPERERFTLILNELGAGLAGRGERPQRSRQAREPGAAGTRQGAEDPRGREPRARETGRRLRQGARSVRAGARAGRGLRRQANTISQAGAATRGSLARNLELFPPFLEQLGPALEHIQRFAEQTTPTFTDLKAAAPGIDKTFTSIPAFSPEPEKFFANLGKTGKSPVRR